MAQEIVVTLESIAKGAAVAEIKNWLRERLPSVVRVIG